MEVDISAEIEKDFVAESENKTIRYPTSTCYGVTNRCDDGSYILFADYDTIYFSVLLKELDNLQKRFKGLLTNFLILETKESINTDKGALGSYHVISFAKLPYQKMREILSYMTVDDQFFKLPKRTAYRSNTLRVSPKFEWTGMSDAEGKDGAIIKGEPRFICWMPCEVAVEPKGEVSTAHLTAYQRYIPTFKHPAFLTRWKHDGCKKIEFKKYDSLGGK